MPERAQSEAVGFATVFGIVLLTLTVVSAGGAAGLDNVRSHHQLSNTEQSFALLADNVEAVTDGAPSRATQLKLGDGRLSMADTAEITVNGTAVANASRTFSYTRTYAPLVYSAADTQIVYSNGALIRAERDGAVVFREADFVVTNDTVLLPLVRTYPTDSQGVAGSSALVQTRRSDRELVRTDRSTYDVTITVTTPRAGAWYSWLSDRPATACSRSGATVTCTLRTDSLYVTVDHVAVAVG